jgi:dTDP-4-dehydrorhamnose reductase
MLHLGVTQVFGICPPKTKLSLFPDGNVTPCCVNDRDGLKRAFDQFEPTHVIHAAGMCDLDVCEQWPSLAYQRNVEGTANIVALSRDCYVMHLSTDLVFSGNNPPLDGYTEGCQPDPISMIGKTFCQAERIVQQLPNWTIVRKGLPMGPSCSGRKGPIDYLAYRFRRGKPLTLFYDEMRSALSSEDLTDGLLKLWGLQASGYFHLGGPKKVSLYDIGKHVIEVRIGDVALNSQHAYATIGFAPKPWP